jgi:transcriptional regulator with XRE-family HTH domain
MDEIAKVVGQRIRELRKARGLSQEALGEKGGFHYSYIGQIERGEKNIALSNLAKIAEALEVGIHQLFSFSHELELLTESEQDFKEICLLLRILSESEIKKLKKALTALYGE